MYRKVSVLTLVPVVVQVPAPTTLYIPVSTDFDATTPERISRTHHGVVICHRLLNSRPFRQPCSFIARQARTYRMNFATLALQYITVLSESPKGQKGLPANLALVRSSCTHATPH